MATEPMIYIVDDDRSVCKALGRLIKSAGYRVETFCSGRDFLDAVPPSARGILILDVCMPEMNGLVLQDKLAVSHPGLKIIFMSAYVQEKDRRNAIKISAGFLLKPFSEESLLELIHSVTAKNHTGGGEADRPGG